MEFKELYKLTESVLVDVLYSKSREKSYTTSIEERKAAQGVRTLLNSLIVIELIQTYDLRVFSMIAGMG